MCGYVPLKHFLNMYTVNEKQQLEETVGKSLSLSHSFTLKLNTLLMKSG